MEKFKIYTKFKQLACKSLITYALSLAILSSIVPKIIFAQINITAPNSSSAALPSASDYATEVLGNPWDMDSSNDLANYVNVSDYRATTLNFSNGFFNIANSTGNGSFFYLISPAFCESNSLGKTGQQFPIDTTKYRYLTIRMYSERPTYLKVLVNFGCNVFENYFLTQGIQTAGGWKTYYIDLATVTRESTNGFAPAWGAANATGLRIDPALDGTSVLIDSVMLTAEPPLNRSTVSYTYTPSLPGALHSLYVDNDMDPFNGINDTIVDSQGTTSAAQISPAKLAPGYYNVVGIESFEFSSLNLDPWDMENSNDFVAPPGMNAAIQSGALHGVTTPSLNYIFLNNFGKTIDASKFRFLQLDLDLNSASGFSINWFGPSGNYIASNYPTPVAGRHTYNIDLGISPNWSGNIGSIQLGFAGGITFNLYSASLRLDTFGLPQIASAVAVSPAPIRINAPALFTFLQPDKEGGVDFATEVLGNPWNMDDSADISSTTNLSSALITPVTQIGGVFGSFFTGINSLAEYRDPIQTSLEAFNQPSRQIDASRFKNLTYRLKIDRPQDINEGSIVRLIWHVAGYPLSYFYNSDDIIVRDGWNSYTQDMTTIPLDVVNHPAGSYPAVPWSGLVDNLRVDAHEFLEPTAYNFDFIKVAADDEANSRFAINFTASDSDQSLANVNINFYLSTAKSTAVGSFIGSSNAANTNFLNLDTSSTPEGKYWVIAEITDGINSYRRLSTGQLHITRSIPQDTENPILSVENPSANSTLYNSVNVAGYALDRRQLAGIEVRVDGNLLGFIKPQNFNQTAHILYPNFTEGSNAGFLSTINLSSISSGTHFMELIAFDTAGNTTSSGRINFTKTSGIDPAPYIPATPASVAPIDVNTVLTTPAPTATPIPPPAPPTTKIAVSYDSKKKILTAKVTEAEECNTLKVIIGSTSSEVQSRSTKAGLSAIKNGGSSVIFKGKITKGIKKVKNGPATYFAVLCNEVLSSPIKKFGRPKIESGLTTTAKWVKYVAPRLK